MKDKKSIFSKIYSGKGFYITSALCLGLIAVAIGVIYRASSNLISEIAYDTKVSTYEITEQAKADKKDEADPRMTEKTTSPSASSVTTQKATQKTTTALSTEERETSADFTREDKKETSSSAVSKHETTADYGNRSYELPAPDEILKDYSENPTYDETMGDWRAHKGVDFTAEKGTTVTAAGNGKVTKVFADPSYGYCIEIDFGDFTGRYCGLEQGTTVKLGDEVKKGDTVGKTGDIPCEAEQEPHFHFEAIQNGKNIDPIKALKR